MVSELEPAAAAVAVHLRLRMATMLNSTRSRNVRTRGSSTWLVAGGAGEIVLTVIRSVDHVR
jgi:hypothetical protein